MQKSNTGVIFIIVIIAAIAGYFGFKQFNKPAAQAPTPPAATQTATPQPAASSDKPAAPAQPPPGVPGTTTPTPPGQDKK